MGTHRNPSSPASRAISPILRPHKKQYPSSSACSIDNNTVYIRLQAHSRLSNIPTKIVSRLMVDGQSIK